MFITGRPAPLVFLLLQLVLIAACDSQPDAGPSAVAGACAASTARDDRLQRQISLRRYWPRGW